MRMSGTLSAAGCTIVTGADPPRNAATVSSGLTVADSPIRRAGALEQIVEALQREGEVRPALRACDRVHLVDDDGVDGAQSVSRP